MSRDMMENIRVYVPWEANEKKYTKSEMETVIILKITSSQNTLFLFSFSCCTYAISLCPYKFKPTHPKRIKYCTIELV